MYWNSAIRSIKNVGRMQLVKNCHGSGLIQALRVTKLLMLRLKLQRKPAEAGIAGLSVRAFKPTGLQAGGRLVL